MEGMPEGNFKKINYSISVTTNVTLFLRNKVTLVVAKMYKAIHVIGFEDRLEGEQMKYE